MLAHEHARSRGGRVHDLDVRVRAGFLINPAHG
jgi:hypothetical protein